MKNIKNIVFILLLGSGYFACSDLLDEKQIGVYSSSTFYQTEKHAQIALAAVYNSLSFGSTQNRFWVIGDVASDDATKGGGAGDQTEITFIEQFNYTRSNGVLDGIWTAYYEGITRANNVIYYVPSIEMDEVLKNRIIGEAKVLRAYFYFNLVNTFGAIPLKINPPLNQAEINLPKSSVVKVYQQIEEDLTEAIDVLEAINIGGDVGRVSKGSALGLLAKTYLYQERWAEVESTITEIDALGIYNLELVYKNNFIDSTQNNNESLFEIQHLSNQTVYQGSYLNQYFAATVDNGYAFNVPLQNFIDEFEQTVGGIYDPRLDYTVGRSGQNWINGTPFNPGWSQTGYLQKKHLQPTKEAPIIGDGSLNYVYMRYADILLMKAESLNELGRSAEALVPLNMVRRRARESYLYDVDLTGSIPVDLLPDITSSNQSDVRDAIRHERRVELGFEFHRFFDLMRYGSQVAENALSDTNFNYEQNRYFLIPLSEIDNNPSVND
jgi:hypothetical protein